MSAKMKFQVRRLRVALWNSLNLWEIFGLSIVICSTQFTFLQSVWHRNQKTIISLTIVCHSISLFLKIAPRSAEGKPEISEKIWFAEWSSLTRFHFRPISNNVALSTWKLGLQRNHVSLSCILMFWFNVFILKHLELNNKSIIGGFSL